MARNVTANSVTAPQQLDDGVLYSMYRISLHTSADDAIVHQAMMGFGETKADFTGVMPGTYYAMVALANADGSLLGPSAMSEDFTVPDDSATLEVPQSVTVTVHPLA